jgi:hypothetical protein
VEQAEQEVLQVQAVHLEVQVQVVQVVLVVLQELVAPLELMVQVEHQV